MKETQLRIIIDVVIEGEPHEVELASLEGVAVVAVEREVEDGKLRSIEARREKLVGYVPVYMDHNGVAHTSDPEGRDLFRGPRLRQRSVGPCTCVCNSGGFCGGCGHAGCGGRKR